MATPRTPEMADGRAFVFDARLPRVVFGAGARRELPKELERLGIAREQFES